MVAADTHGDRSHKCGELRLAVGNWQIFGLGERERNLLLVERLRQDIAAGTHGDSRATTTATLSDLPPPTTEQPPAQQPTARQPDPVGLAPLTLPIRQSPLPGKNLTSPLLRDSPPGRIDNEPQLTGVVQGPGGSSSAIFQVGQGSLSAGIGEPIGNSGWTLDAINDTGAVIRRNGERRNLSVGGVF